MIFFMCAMISSFHMSMNSFARIFAFPHMPYSCDLKKTPPQIVFQWITIYFSLSPRLIVRQVLSVTFIGNVWKYTHLFIQAKTVVSFPAEKEKFLCKTIASYT